MGNLRLRGQETNLYQTARDVQVGERVTLTDSFGTRPDQVYDMQRVNNINGRPLEQDTLVFRVYNTSGYIEPLNDSYLYLRPLEEPNSFGDDVEHQIVLDRDADHFFDSDGNNQLDSVKDDAMRYSPRAQEIFRIDFDPGTITDLRTGEVTEDPNADVNYYE